MWWLGLQKGQDVSELPLCNVEGLRGIEVWAGSGFLVFVALFGERLQVLNRHAKPQALSPKT